MAQKNPAFSTAWADVHFPSEIRHLGLDTFSQDAITPLASGAEPNAPRDIPDIAPDARIAQLVEQRIENPRVGGSNPPPGTTPFLKEIIELRIIARGVDALGVSRLVAFDFP